MAIEVEQIINTTDTDYPDIYGHVTAVVHDTETGERSTASYEYDHFTTQSDAEASAIQAAINKL